MTTPATLLQELHKEIIRVRQPLHTPRKVPLSLWLRQTKDLRAVLQRAYIAERNKDVAEITTSLAEMAKIPPTPHAVEPIVIATASIPETH